MAVTRDLPEESQEIVDERHQVREHDVVEVLPEIDVLPGRLRELKMRMAFARQRQHAAAHVDSQADRRLKRREQIAGATAHLEHTRSRRDLEARYLLDQSTVSAAMRRGATGPSDAVEEPCDRFVLAGVVRA